MNRSPLYVFLILFTLLVVSPQSGRTQEELEISFQRIVEIVSLDEELDRLELSPSGSRLAVINHEALCIYSIENEASHCDGLPWGDTYTSEVYNLGQTYLKWAFSEQYIVFSRYPFCCLAWDSDIWLYNVESHEFRNLTEDEVQDYYISFGASTDENEILDIPVDFLPFWDSSSQFIYFFRTYPSETDIWDNLGLYRVSIMDDSVQLIYDFKEEFKPPIYAANISPDSTKIVLIVGGSVINANVTGIYIIDLSQNTLEYSLSVDNVFELLTDQVEGVAFTSFSDVMWQNNSQFYAVVQGFDLDVNSSPINFRDWFFGFDIESQTIEFQNLLTSDLVSGSTSVFVNLQDNSYFFIVDEPNNGLQRLYYGSNEKGFQLIAELPHFSAQYNGRIVHIADNNTISSGGILIELPTSP